MDGRIDRDLPCVACGYNLRGLPPNGRCPECGVELSVTLNAPSWEFMGKKWLKRLRLGLGLITLGAVMFIIPPLCALLTILGIWIAAARPEGSLLFGYANVARHTARAALTFGVLACVIVLTLPLPFWTELNAVPLLLAAMSFIAPVAFAVYIHGLARQFRLDSAVWPCRLFWEATTLLAMLLLIAYIAVDLRPGIGAATCTVVVLTAMAAIVALGSWIAAMAVFYGEITRDNQKRHAQG